MTGQRPTCYPLPGGGAVHYEGCGHVNDLWPRYDSGEIMWRELEEWEKPWVGCPLCGAAVADTEQHVRWHEPPKEPVKEPPPDRSWVRTVPLKHAHKEDR